MVRESSGQFHEPTIISNAVPLEISGGASASTAPPREVQALGPALAVAAPLKRRAPRLCTLPLQPGRRRESPSLPPYSPPGGTSSLRYPSAAALPARTGGVSTRSVSERLGVSSRSRRPSWFRTTHTASRCQPIAG